MPIKCHYNTDLIITFKLYQCMHNTCFVVVLLRADIGAVPAAGYSSPYDLNFGGSILYANCDCDGSIQSNHKEYFHIKYYQIPVFLRDWNGATFPAKLLSNNLTISDDISPLRLNKLTFWHETEIHVENEYILSYKKIWLETFFWSEHLKGTKSFTCLFCNFPWQFRYFIFLFPVLNLVFCRINVY